MKEHKCYDMFGGCLDTVPIGLPAAGFAERNIPKYNLCKVAKEIQKYIREYYELNPNETKQEPAQKYALKKIMFFGEGQYDIKTIKSMVEFERCCYPKFVEEKC